MLCMGCLNVRRAIPHATRDNGSQQAQINQSSVKYVIMKARITSPLLYNPQWLPLVGIICAVMRRWSQDDDPEREKLSERDNAPWMSGGRQGSSERGTKRGGITIVNKKTQSNAYITKKQQKKTKKPNNNNNRRRQWTTTTPALYTNHHRIDHRKWPYLLKWQRSAQKWTKFWTQHSAGKRN